MTYTVFCIDNWEDLHTNAKFMRHLDTQRAMGKLKGNVVQAFGYYAGKIEPSFVMYTEDYEKFCTPFTKGQESVLVVPESVKQPVWLKYADGTTEVLGTLKTTKNTPDAIGWTYHTGVFWYV